MLNLKMATFRLMIKLILDVHQLSKSKKLLKNLKSCGCLVSKQQNILRKGTFRNEKGCSNTKHARQKRVKINNCVTILTATNLLMCFLWTGDEDTSEKVILN